MKEQLIHYVDLLFAGAPYAGDVKQEILQNTLDRYDDLTAQGKSPEAAYRLAISGIGDINEILGGEPSGIRPTPQAVPPCQTAVDTWWKKAFRAIAVALYILSPIPLFILQDELGLCALLACVAVGTVLMILGGKSKNQAPNEVQKSSPLKKSVGAVVWAVGLCVYVPLSFLTRAWHITWLVFPLTSAVQGLIFASIDLKEAEK